MSEEEEVYEVESILDKRTVDGRIEYLVKWVGYDDPEENTWVEEEDCMCKDLIKEFEKKLASAKKSPRKSRSPSRRVRFSPENTPSTKETPKKVEIVVKKEVLPKQTSSKKEVKKNKEFSVTARVQTEPVLRIEVEPENESENSGTEDLRGIESSRIVGNKFSWRVFASIPVLLSIGVLAYFKIYRPEGQQDVSAILDTLKKNIVKHF
ncbi:hypothetical protein FO519_007418 [Halicephalobus sp. NKZ332]|nr:hypothetical protein FO519_007418 [Halicephalobus sp. NKZ332]